MKKLPRPDNTIDFRSILSMNPQQRLDFARTKDGMSFLASLTASEYAKLFPDYFRKQLPDIGQTVMSRPIQGRSWPPPGSSIRNPTYSRPSEGNNVPSSPGTGSAPRQPSGSAPRQPSGSAPSPATQGPANQKIPDVKNIWQGGTPQVNTSGEIPVGLAGALKDQRRAFFEVLDKNPALKKKLLAVAANEQGTHPQGTQAVIEETINRAIIRGGGVKGGLERLEREIRFTSEGGYYEDSRGQQRAWNIVNNKKSLEILEAAYERVREGGNVSQFAYGNASAGVARNKITGAGGIKANKTVEINGETFFEPNSDEPGYIKNYSAWKKELLERAKKNAEEGIETPSLALFTKEALDQADPKPAQTATKVEQQKKPPLGFGDSVMNQILTKNKNIEKGYARDGAAPKEIFAEIKKMDQTNLKGREIFLSTGLLNNPKDLDTAREMIKYIKDSGGTVTLVGGPQGEGTRGDLKDVHRTIEQLGSELGVKTTPAYTPAPDGVHVSNQFLGKLIPAVTPIANSGIPSKIYDTNLYGRGPNLSRDQLIRQGIDPLLIESIYEGSKVAFGDPKDPRTRYVVQVNNAARDDPTSKHGQSKAADVQIFDRETGQYVGGTESIFKNALGNPHTFRHFEVWAQGQYKYLHDKYGEKVANRLTSGLYFRARQNGSFDNMHISLDEGQSQGSIRGGATEKYQEILRRSGATPSQGMGDISKWKSPFAPSDDVVPQETAAAVQPEKVVTPVSQRGLTYGIPKPEQNEKPQEPSKLMFNTSRAYTESEVKSMVDKYGKNLIIGANMDDPKEYEQVRALAEKYGVRMHGYSMGRGAPQSSWGNQFPDEQKEIQRRAKEMGISVDQWYSGGWMDYEINRLKALGNKAPAQIELDNINDAKSASDLEKELLKFDKFRQESGIKTQIVPKNFNTREYEVYNKLLSEKKIAPDLAVPLNIVESKYVKGAEKPTAEAGHAYGPMPKDNIKEYATQEPLEQPASGKVKENKYGGDLRSRNSKESTFLVNAQGVLGSVSPGETIDYRGDGRIKVVPNERTNPNELIRQSMDTLMNNDKDAETEIQQNRTSMAGNQSPSPMSYSPADWKNEMMKATDLKVFSSVSFERSVRVSRFDKSGDSGLGGHFDTYSTAIS